MEVEYCPICLDVFDRPCNLIPCRHVFCGPCLETLVILGNRLCPLCRTQIRSAGFYKKLEYQEELTLMKRFQGRENEQIPFDLDKLVENINKDVENMDLEDYFDAINYSPLFGHPFTFWAIFCFASYLLFIL